MTLASELAVFDALPIEEKIRVVQDLWDRIADEAGQLAPSAAHRAELDRRLDARAEREDAGIPWSAVRDRIRNGT